MPEVDPDDVKAVWREYQDTAKDNPGVKFGIDLRVLEHVCKPGADVRAVYYRQAALDLLRLLSQQKPFSEMAGQEFKAKITALMTDGAFRDAAFRAMAKVPMEWMEVGVVRDSPPYDFEEFLRLCEQQETGT